MRALVTGAAGFVGGWLVSALRERGAEVHGLGLAPGGGDVRWHVGDVRDPVVLRAALEHAAPDAVFHLAGISSVGGADEDPGVAADVNVTATVRLLAEVNLVEAPGETCSLRFLERIAQAHVVGRQTDQAADQRAVRAVALAGRRERAVEIDRRVLRRSAEDRARHEAETTGTRGV